MRDANCPKASRSATSDRDSRDVQLGDDGTGEIRDELTMRKITKPSTATATYRPLIEYPVGNLRSDIRLAATVDPRERGLDWQADLPEGGDALRYAVALVLRVELVKPSEPA